MLGQEVVVVESRAQASKMEQGFSEQSAQCKALQAECEKLRLNLAESQQRVEESTKIILQNKEVWLIVVVSIITLYVFIISHFSPSFGQSGYCFPE